MSEINRVKNWFDSGELIRPSTDVLNFVDLIRALLHLAGADRIESEPGVKELCRRIGPAANYIFILVDGLGVDQLHRLPKKAFLRKHMVCQIQSVFLSTTATAYTTLATGEWPCSHGVPGWFMYLEESDMSVIPLPFQERTTKRALEEFGVSVDEIFPVDSIWSDLKYDTLSILPADIVHSTYSRYFWGEALRIGYNDLSKAIQIILQRIMNTSGQSFTYLYLPELDNQIHDKGTDHEDVLQLLIKLNRSFGDLAESLNGQARIVISADHGLINVPKKRQFRIPENDPVRMHLRCRPTGEPSIPIFHVQEGHEEAFAFKFRSRFGEYFALLTPDEIEQLRLLGPGPLSEVMKRRLGTFVGIPLRPTTFCIEDPDDKNHIHIGHHGGLSNAEMHIPLILA